MGMYASVEITIKQTTVDGVAKSVGLPETTYVPDGLCFLTAKDIKVWEETLNMWTDMLEQGELFNQQSVYAYGVMQIVVEHAKNYISEKCSEANGLQLTGRARLEFFRKATKEYKMWFN